jgi:hypothetical protein
LRPGFYPQDHKKEKKPYIEIPSHPNQEAVINNNNNNNNNKITNARIWRKMNTYTAERV